MVYPTFTPLVARPTAGQVVAGDERGVYHEHQADEDQDFPPHPI